MKRTKGEIMEMLRKKIGDDDESLQILEDVTDTFGDVETSDEWKTRYDELDRQWRERYRERFFTSGEEVKRETEAALEKDEDADDMTFAELFEEREGDYN